MQLTDMKYFSGTVITPDGPIEGYVLAEDGLIAEISEGVCPETPVSKGFIMSPPVNGHTHCADCGMTVPNNIGLNDLVGPGGLKHRYLSEASKETLTKNIKEYSEKSYSNGIGTFIDFREGGVEGCKLLRNAVPDAVIMGRPVSDEYDPSEINEILEVADGIGLSGINDMPLSYSESVAEHTKRKGKMFAIHASEGKREDIDDILALSPSFIVHMASAEKMDLIKCADEDVPIVICPRSNAFFGLNPPYATMEEVGNRTILGTDNAMLCSPDLREEAGRYLSVLASQGGTRKKFWETLVIDGRKLLYDEKGIGLRPGMKADITVFPSKDGTVDGMFMGNERILRFNMTK